MRHEQRLELTHYEDRVAHFSAPDLPLMRGFDTTISVHLRHEEWDERGRPTVITVEWAITGD